MSRVFVCLDKYTSVVEVSSGITERLEWGWPIATSSTGQKEKQCKNKPNPLASSLSSHSSFIHQSFALRILHIFYPCTCSPFVLSLHCFPVFQCCENRLCCTLDLCFFPIKKKKKIPVKHNLLCHPWRDHMVHSSFTEFVCFCHTEGVSHVNTLYHATKAQFNVSVVFKWATPKKMISVLWDFFQGKWSIFFPYLMNLEGNLLECFGSSSCCLRVLELTGKNRRLSRLVRQSI